MVKICNTCLRELRFPPFRTRILLVNMLSNDVIDRESKCCQMVKLFIHSFSIHRKGMSRFDRAILVSAMFESEILRLSNELWK